MIQATVFSGTEGRLRSGRLLYLTVFGACTLVRPTVARAMWAQRDVDRAGPRVHRRPFFLTVFGAAEIKSPTLAEEFLDLREMLGSETAALEDWQRAIVDLNRSEGSVGSLTLFGSFDECKLPTESQEIDALALHRHLGNISDSAGHVLQHGVGQRDAERYATVRQAVGFGGLVTRHT